ncbi:unnamed protein product [Anisakis simplex]|uniref:Uncharacterized protein n=1 Tax=Anisakis simplex TaxID=6269 RepID=A0A0M3K356_ANISI|nr:unnamed protein product [Anisakis simplex]
MDVRSLKASTSEERQEHRICDHIDTQMPSASGTAKSTPIRSYGSNSQTRQTVYANSSFKRSSFRKHLGSMVLVESPTQEAPRKRLLRNPTQSIATRNRTSTKHGCWAVFVDLSKLCVFVAVCLTLILLLECFVYLIYLFFYRLPPIRTTSISERISVRFVQLFKHLYYDLTT